MSNAETKEVSDDRQRERQSQVKRPMNAFMLWSKEKRRKISSVDPSLHNSHISKILGEEWKRLPTREKDPYIKQSKMLMEKHKQDHPDYHYKPRQNKLTKALKELSSLRSTLATTPGLTSRIKSLASVSTLGPRYPTHYVLPRPRSSVAHDDMPYHHPRAYYPRSLPCVGCTCCLEYAENLRSHYQYRPDLHASSKDMKFHCDERFTPMHGVWRVNTTPPPRSGWSVPFLVDDARVKREEHGEQDENDASTRAKHVDESESEIEGEEDMNISM